MIINFRFMQYFLLGLKDFSLSTKYFVNFMIISSDYGRILRVFKILRKNNYLPSMIFYF